MSDIKHEVHDYLETRKDREERRQNTMPFDIFLHRHAIDVSFPTLEYEDENESFSPMVIIEHSKGVVRVRVWNELGQEEPITMEIRKITKEETP